MYADTAKNDAWHSEKSPAWPSRRSVESASRPKISICVASPIQNGPAAYGSTSAAASATTTAAVAVAGHQASLPAMPRGRTRSSSAIGANSTKYENSGSSQRPYASSRPTTSAPIIAPPRLPRPPTITTTSA